MLPFDRPVSYLVIHRTNPGAYRRPYACSFDRYGTLLAPWFVESSIRLFGFSIVVVVSIPELQKVRLSRLPAEPVLEGSSNFGWGKFVCAPYRTNQGPSTIRVVVAGSRNAVSPV